MRFRDRILHRANGVATGVIDRVTWGILRERKRALAIPQLVNKLISRKTAFLDARLRVKIAEIAMQTRSDARLVVWTRTIVARVEMYLIGLIQKLVSI